MYVCTYKTPPDDFPPFKASTLSSQNDASGSHRVAGEAQHASLPFSVFPSPFLVVREMKLKIVIKNDECIREKKRETIE